MNDASGTAFLVHSSQFPPDIQLLCSVLSLDPAAREKNRLQDLARQVNNPQSFVRTVRHHRLVGTVASPATGVRDNLPAEFWQPLVESLPGIAAKSMKLTSHLGRIAESFDQENILFVPLKGVVLGQQLYTPPTLRHPGDIDLLVKQDQIKQACRLMIELGYQPLVPSAWPTPYQWKVLLWSHNHFAFSSPDHSITIDLHWKVEPRSRCFALDNQAKTFSSVELSNHRYRQFSKPLQLTYLAYHGTRHGWASLHWLYDIRLLAQAMTGQDWAQAIVIGRRFNLLNSTRLAIQLTCDLLGLDRSLLPAELKDRLKDRGRVGRLVRDRIVKGLPCTLGEKMDLVRLNLKFSDRREDILRILVKQVIDVNDWTRIRLPDSLFFLYLGYRPVSWIVRRLRMLAKR